MSRSSMENISLQGATELYLVKDCARTFLLAVIQSIVACGLHLDENDMILCRTVGLKRQTASYYLDAMQNRHPARYRRTYHHSLSFMSSNCSVVYKYV